MRFSGPSFFRRCLIICFILVIHTNHNAYAQCCNSYSYATASGWTMSGSGYTIGSDTFRFNATPGASYNYATHPLGCTLSDYSWKGEIDFKYTGRGSVGVAHTLLGVTAGPLNAWNTNGTLYTPSNQDAIEAYISSPAYGTQSTDSIFGHAKNGSTWNTGSHGIYVNTNTTYYIRIERLSPSQGRISVFTNAARTLHVPGSPQYFPVGCDITGLTTLQHGCVPQGSYLRTLTATLANPKVCDTIKPQPVVFDTTVCNQMILSHGRSVDSSGLYSDTILSFGSCDSIIVLNVSIAGSKSLVDTAVCATYISPSGRYQTDSSMLIIDTIPNHVGCDSIITINVRNQRTRYTLDTSVCNNYISPSGRYQTDSSMLIIDTISNHLGCDSIITIHVKNQRTRYTFDTSVCSSYTSPSGRFRADSNMMIIDTIPNTAGCDSILNIRVKVLRTRSAIDTVFCGDLVSPSGKYTYTTGGIYSDTIPNQKGCDSVIEIHFSRNGSKAVSIKVHSCTSYVSPSGRHQYLVSGIYIDTVLSINRCDSIITIDLKIEPLVIHVSKSNDISCDTPYAILSVNKGRYFSWSPSQFLSDAAANNPVATPKQKETYHVTATDSSGCTANDSIEVDVNKDEVIKELPNVFTPNNDGSNDLLCLESITSLKQVKCSIYNRWGTLVFQSVDPHGCWNGKNATGTDLSEGTYFFILKGTSICDTEIIEHGSIQLIR